ncbi:hypothetical protein CC85DRAFT_285974 [Cutaneotrichosporon oleaginosum]|uniref:HIG1 domain-containing protein n=1 Tax=Cutaneotrichosporon oleaginosum TaxID=879819 RepID=A0A0J0XLB2_9TREE|nr:uncharacterized protein CC85DRAFT_285974 [Cutaneotrichosporon oleaginosum]KLT41885.1 hypothetical protein CC85DRAFT_285974 [Cutaneotrichosporon oleaginosum]TXT12486.1 hypothetical protein COLE_02896 [Cutaneotrichosporon oleaginosum]
MTTPMPAENDEPKGMTYLQHGWQKCKEQPMVPIGVAATTFALLGATASLRSGNRKQFQHFLRLRVAAQGLTVVAMVVGAYMISNKAEEAKMNRERALTGELKGVSTFLLRCHSSVGSLYLSSRPAILPSCPAVVSLSLQRTSSPLIKPTLYFCSHQANFHLTLAPAA